MKLTFYTGVLCAAIAALNIIVPTGAVHINEDSTVEIVDGPQLVQNQLEAVCETQAKVDCEGDKDDSDSDGAAIKEKSKEKMSELIDEAMKKKRDRRALLKAEKVIEMVQGEIMKIRQEEQNSL